MANNLASRRLNPEEMQEMTTMGFQSPSQYLTWKSGNMTDEQLDYVLEQKRKLLDDTGLNGTAEKKVITKSIEVHPSSRSIEDAVLITEMKLRLDQFQKESDMMKSRDNEGLGKLDIMVENRVMQVLKEKEQNQMALDYKDLQIKIRDKDAELSAIKLELESLKSKINAMEYVEKYAPAALKAISGLAKGVTNFKTTGFAGIFEELGNAASPQVKSLSQEDEYCLEMGRNIQSMFNEDELPNIMITVAMLGQNKELIPQLPILLDKLSQPSNTSNKETINEEDKNEEEKKQEDTNYFK